MAAFDAVYQALGASFVPEELTGNPRVALVAGADRVAGGHKPPEAWLAIGLATLARGNVTAARRLFGRVRHLAAPDSAEALLATLADALSVQTGYAFLPGGGMNYFLSEAAYRQNTFDTTQRRNVDKLRDTLSEIWWPPLVTLLGEVAPWRRSVLGPDFQTGRLVSPDGAERLAVGAQQACDRLAAEADAAAWPTLAAFARRTQAELALRLGAPDGPALLQQAADAYLAAGFPAGQAACVLAAADWLLAPLSGPVSFDTAVMEPAQGDCALPPGYEQLEIQRFGADTGPAVSLAGQAAGIFTAIGSGRGLAAVALHRSYAAFCRGGFTDQQAYADEALRHARTAADAPLAQAAIMHRMIAAISAGELGGHEPAAESIARWGRRSGSFSYALGLGLILARLGRFWRVRRNDHDRASACLASAVHLFTVLGATQNALQCRAEISHTQARLGLRTTAQIALRDTIESFLGDAVSRPPLAKEAQRRARDLTSTLLKDAIGSADPAACLAAASLGDRVLADAGPLPAQSPDELLRRGHGDDFERALYVIQISRSIPQVRYSAHILSARAARAEGDTARFDAEIHAALEIVAAMPFPDSAFHEAAVFGLARRYDEAEAAYLRYLDGGGVDAQMTDLIEPMRRFAGAGSAALDARAHANDLNAATFFAHIRRFGRAAAHLAAVERIAGPSWWQQEDQPWSARALPGEIAEGLGQVRPALAAYDEALTLVESDLRQLLRDDQRTAFANRRDARNIYLASARASLTAGAGSEADAFNRAERGRARALTILVGGTGSEKELSPDDLALIRRWRQTAARADELASAETIANGPASSLLAQRSAEVRQALAALDDEVRRRRTALAPVLNPAVAPITAGEVSRLLPPGTLLLTWVQVDDNLLAFALPAGQGPRCRTGTIDADDLTAALNRFARACRSGMPWEGPAAEVARLFLDPFAAEIRQSEALVVVPFLAGHRIPFHLLPFDGEAAGTRRTVSVLPAMALIRHLTSQRPQTSAEHLAAAPRLVVGNPSGMAWIPPGGTPIESYDPLRFAETEARAIARPEDVCLIGPAASRERVLPEIDRHQVLHFAAHAHVEQEVAQLSAILLANGQSLSVADMVGQGLAAELVVLSACDTGTGTLTDGDEVVGLTRGLFAAGARQAVVSLWPVNDLTTCLLMRRFYQRLADMSVAGALGQARRELVALTLNQQVDELVALQEELADQEASPAVLATIERAAAARRGRDAQDHASDFRHPRFWAPFIHLGLP